MAQHSCNPQHSNQILGGMWHLWKILLHFLAYIAGSHKEGLLHKAAAQFQSTKTWRLLQALALCIWSGVDICCIQNAQRLHYIPSLKLTQHLKVGLPNRKVLFQPSIFRGHVSLRECRKILHQSIWFLYGINDSVYQPFIHLNWCRNFVHMVCNFLGNPASLQKDCWTWFPFNYQFMSGQHTRTQPHLLHP